MNIKYDNLEKLAKLKDQWIISEEEYWIEKEKILSWNLPNLNPYSPQTLLWLSFLLWPFGWLVITYNNFKAFWRKDFLEKTWWIFIFLLLVTIEIIFIEETEENFPFIITVFYWLLYWIMNVGIFSSLQLKEVKEWKNKNPDKKYVFFASAIWWGLIAFIFWIILLYILLIIFALLYPELNLLND